MEAGWWLTPVAQLREDYQESKPPWVTVSSRPHPPQWLLPSLIAGGGTHFTEGELVGGSSLY